jgi:hypothetical protein
LNPIVFKNFAPGIADNPSVNYPPETATRANTWRCIANRTGALVPLPRRQAPFSLPHDAASSTTQIAVVGLFLPPIGLLPSSGGAAFTPNTFPEHELFVGTERLEGGTRTHKLFRYRRYEAPLGTGFDTIKNIATADTSTVFRPSGMGFCTIRSNRADSTQPGCPVVIALWGTGQTNMYLTEFPDDQNQASLTPYDIFANNQFILGLAAHQGRVVTQLATVYNHGPGTVTFMGENLFWSRVNDVTTAQWGRLFNSVLNPTPQVFVPENPSGFAFLTAMSANELFAVKGGHGGMYVTGDLDDPTVVSLPMVTGAELVHTPAVNSIGVTYGNRNSGMWTWTHGDNSQLISPNMNPTFWVVTPTTDLDDFGGICYQLASSDDWILTPNNFLFDTVGKGWWRLEDPGVAQFRFMASNWHFIYAAESYYTNVKDSPIHAFKRESPSRTFTWQSHPIWQSVADIVNVNTIELIAEGQGTVTLTLTALGGDTNSIEVTLADCGYPERFREAFAIRGQYLQLRIDSAGPNDLVPAPTVYSVTLYPFTEQPIGRTL